MAIGPQSVPCIKLSLATWHVGAGEPQPGGTGRPRGPLRGPLITGVLWARSVHFEPLVYTPGIEKKQVLVRRTYNVNKVLQRTLLWGVGYLNSLLVDLESHSCSTGD